MRRYIAFSILTLVAPAHGITDAVPAEHHWNSLGMCQFVGWFYLLEPKILIKLTGKMIGNIGKISEVSPPFNSPEGEGSHPDERDSFGESETY